MDYRKLHGKTFENLKTDNEKILFLLEYFQKDIKETKDDIIRINNELYKTKRFLKFNSKLLLNIMDIQNKNRIWKEDYIKKLQKEFSEID